MRRRLALWLAVVCLAGLATGAPVAGSAVPDNHEDVHPSGSPSPSVGKREAAAGSATAPLRTFAVGSWEFHLVSSSIEPRALGLVATPGTVLCEVYLELANVGPAPITTTATDFLLWDETGQVFENMLAAPGGRGMEFPATIASGTSCTMAFITEVPKRRGRLSLEFAPAQGGRGSKLSVPLT